MVRCMEKRLVTTALAVLCISLLSACSRTVTWEEEVPLNTGEVIVIKRSMPWVYKGGFGNPFDIAMRPTREQTLGFTYQGKEYSFTGRVDINWIAISPQSQPTLVAPAVSFGWNTANNYYCVTPYYVQFTPDATGKQWVWPEKIDPWLYGLPANIMVNTPKLDEPRKARYTSVDRNERDQTYRLQAPYAKQVDALYQAESGCIRKYDPRSKPNWTEK
jgi:hypothetical protein